MKEEEHQNELVQTPKQRAENCFRCNVFAFLIPLLEVIKVVAAPVASVIFIGIAGIILAGSAVALAVSMPLFIIFSPVLLPATIATTLAFTGIGAIIAFKVTAVGLIIWLIK
ncbi:Oleosin GRP-17 [Raphanus sativus]|nr:Oleosin GRP-17 [Raphanus sativus]